MSFFEELKRRNVFRVGIAYVISAWVLLQFVDLVLDNIQAPDWVMKVFMLALMVGFPLAIFFAWAFEVTPEGIKKEQDVDRSQSIAKQTGHKLDRSIIVILLVALVYFAWDNFSETAPEPQVVPQVALQTTAVESTEKSIAVLPFVNMSTDADNEFFSDGIAEEILNVLASIPDLKVAARTSAFAFKGTNTNIADIAEELGVTHVLEGSVRKSGNQVRVTAQLIKADDGFHLWSANYDRELTNIFAIQDEIADSIAEALKVSLELTSGSAGNLTGTNSLEAYEYYLKGMSLWHQRTAIGLNAAIDDFEAAITIDPEFAKAHAGLALTWSVIDGYQVMDTKITTANAKAAAERALALDPGSIEGLAVLGAVARVEYQYKVAAEFFEQAMAINPSYATAYQWFGGMLTDMGDINGSIAKYQKAWSLDPRSRIIGNNLAWRLNGVGRDREALKIAKEVLGFAPEFPDGLNLLFNLSILSGDCDAARPYLEKLVKVVGKTHNSTQVYMDLCQSDEPETRALAIQTMLAWSQHDFPDPEAPTLSYLWDMMILFVEFGEFDAAVQLLKAESVEPYDVMLTRTRITPNGIRFQCDPRVIRLVEESGIPPSTHPAKCD